MWRDAADDEEDASLRFYMNEMFRRMTGYTPNDRKATNRDGVPMDPPLEPGGQKLAWNVRGSHAYGFHNGRICKLYLRKGADGKLAYFLTRGRVMSTKKILSIAKLMEKVDKEKR